MKDEQQKKVFSRNLRHYIAQSGKQQKEVADELGFNQKTFNGWCNALSMPTMGKVQAIADYFGIGKTDLIDEHSDDGFALTATERTIITNYRASDQITKQMILRLLGMESKEEESQSLA